MSGGFQTFTSRMALPGAQAQPVVSDNAQTAAAMGNAATAIGTFAAQHKESQLAIVKAQGMTRYLGETAELDKQFENDPDPSTAPQRFAEREKQIRQEVLGTVPDASSRAVLETQLTRYSAVSNNQVRQQSLKREADGFSANLDTTQQQVLARASRAPTPAEREGVTAPYFEQIDDGVKRGWISQQQAQVRRSGIARTLDDTDAHRLIDQNPRAALDALNDPAKFTSLDPLVRQARIQAAQARADAVGVQDASNAARFDPAKGIAMVGRVTRPDQMVYIVDKVLIPQESSGNPRAESPKGAAGLTQFVPDTARMVARQMKVTDLEGLDDAGVREVLKSRPDLARAMGVKHMNDLATRYEGRLAPAFAAYHAGAGNADKWHQAAVEKFGPGYSAADFMSVVPESVSDGNKTTRAYVGDMFTRLGADPAATPRFSQSASFQAANAVGSELDSQLGERRRIRDSLASVTRGAADDIITSYRAGYAQDPQLVATTRADLIQSATGGNADSARKLRDLDYAERIAPAIRGAYTLPPAQLEAALQGERARLARLPHVTPDERTRLDALESVASTVTRERNLNPVGLLERSGAPVVAVPTRLDAPEMAASLAMRSQQSLEAQRRFNGELKPFKPEEDAALKQAFTDANPDQRFRFVETAAREMAEPAYEAAMTALGADKLTITAGRFAVMNPALGQRIMKGAALLKQPGVDAKSVDLRDALKATLGGSVYPAGVQDQMIDAAQAVYVADRDGKGALFDVSDPRALQASIEAVTGKLYRHNGVKTPLPEGVTAGQFDMAIKAMTLADMGGAAMGRDGKPVDLDHIKSSARLRPAGVNDGRYRVVLPGVGGADAAVLDAKGQALIIDINVPLKRMLSRIETGQAWPVEMPVIQFRKPGELMTDDPLASLRNGGLP